MSDDKAWGEGDKVKPNVMSVINGSLSYKDIMIEAVSGPKNGVYALVCRVEYPEDGSSPKYHGFIGIGCYGYNGDEWVGILDSEVSFLKNFINGLVDSYALSKEAIEKIQWEEPLRFNQGDQYFANSLNFEVPATPPGESDPLIISGILDGMKK